MQRHLAGMCCAMLLATSAQAADVVSVPGGTITIEFTRKTTALDRAALVAWVRNSARAVTAYYGHFPVTRTKLLVTPVGGRGISGGRTWAEDGGLIRIRVGEQTTSDDYARDWVLVHEMTHLALPSLPDAHAWLEEGLATYVESIARAQAGGLSPEAVWAGFVRGMPNGLPQASDRGLDRTHTWGRTYWGGALFCLQADLEIRRRTENRYGLRDALRAILAAGNMEKFSGIDDVLATGDRAVGVAVLEELYARHRNAAVATDLGALWHQLGVIPEGRTVRLDDATTESWLRRSLTAPYRSGEITH